MSNDDVSVEAIAAQMDREGVPYTRVPANPEGRPAIDVSSLADAGAGRAKYQGAVMPHQSGGDLPAEEARRACWPAPTPAPVARS